MDFRGDVSSRVFLFSFFFPRNRMESPLQRSSKIFSRPLSLSLSIETVAIVRRAPMDSPRGPPSSSTHHPPSLPLPSSFHSPRFSRPTNAPSLSHLSVNTHGWKRMHAPRRLIPPPFPSRFFHPPFISRNGKPPGLARDVGGKGGGKRNSRSVDRERER